MNAVVNRLRLNTTISPDVWQRAETELPTLMKQIAGFETFYAIEVSPDEMVLVIVADTAETLDRIATEVGNSWMREHVAPHLAEPPSRQIGRIVASG